MVALGAAVTALAVVAVAARDPRVAIVGLVGTMAAGPLLAEGVATPLALAARIVAATLAGYLIRIAVRRSPVTHGSRVGWPAEAAIGAAAFVTGLGLSGVLGPGPLEARGPVEALATGTALLALAVAPLADPRDAFRLAIGLGLAVTGADVVRAGLAGGPSAVEQLAIAALVVALGGAAAVLIVRGADAIDQPAALGR